MVIDHTHPLYAKKHQSLSKGNRYNGAYYYSKEIVKNIIPLVHTDRHWVTVRIPEVPIPPHSIVFIHNNRNPNYYSYLKNYEDVILVCSTERTFDNMRFYGDPILLPLSVDVKQVEKYYRKHKTKSVAFAGREIKITNKVPRSADILTNLPQSELLKQMAKYQKVYAVGRTAIQAKILGCEIGVYDNMYPDPKFWQVIDNEDVALMLDQILKVKDQA